MPTLYVTDLDGTLLDSDITVSATTTDIFRRLTAAGALITVATARTPATVVPLLQGTPTSAPAIVMTGAALWHRSRGCYTDVAYMSSDDVDTALACCHDCGVYPFVYTLGSEPISMQVYHAREHLSAAEQVFFDQRRDLVLKHFNLNQPLPAGDNGRTVLFFAMGDSAAISAAAERVSAATECYVSCYPDTYDPTVRLLEIFAPGVSKAAAVQRLRRSVGADRVVVFGDNLNDLDMMRHAADVDVAVANARPEVLEAADVVIGPNTASSVARYIEQDFTAQNS